jgi:hypothetical protein
MTVDGGANELLRGFGPMVELARRGKHAAIALASTIFLLAATKSPGEAGRLDGAANGSAMTSRPKCQPRIIAKCK